MNTGHPVIGGSPVGVYALILCLFCNWKSSIFPTSRGIFRPSTNNSGYTFHDSQHIRDLGLELQKGEGDALVP